MRLLKTIKICGTFYKNFLLFSILITLSCTTLFWKNGFSGFKELLWFKIATLALTYYFINSYKGKAYYYYYNLGISKTVLWATTVAFDFSLYLLVLLLTYTFR